MKTAFVLFAVVAVVLIQIGDASPLLNELNVPILGSAEKTNENISGGRYRRSLGNGFGTGGGLPGNLQGAGNNNNAAGLIAL